MGMSLEFVSRAARRPRRGERAFTLVELIGVLAIISLLSAMLAPRVFQAISDGKVARLLGEVRTIESAVASWGKDIGTLNRVDAACVASDRKHFDFIPYLTGESLTDCFRYKGPYIDKTPYALGGSVELINGINSADSVTPTNWGFDLNGDGRIDNAYRRTILLRYTGLESDREINAIEAILDDGMPNSSARASHGKVKFDIAAGEMSIYIAHN